MHKQLVAHDALFLGLPALPESALHATFGNLRLPWRSLRDIACRRRSTARIRASILPACNKRCAEDSTLRVTWAFSVGAAAHTATVTMRGLGDVITAVKKLRSCEAVSSLLVLAATPAPQHSRPSGSTTRRCCSCDDASQLVRCDASFFMRWSWRLPLPWCWMPCPRSVRSVCLLVLTVRLRDAETVSGLSRDCSCAEDHRYSHSGPGKLSRRTTSRGQHVAHLDSAHGVKTVYLDSD